MIEEYTTYADVRAALGVSDEEIDDSTLALETFSTQLEEDLYAIDDGLVALYESLLEERTADEDRFYKLVRLYSTYAVAWFLVDSAELFGFLKTTDGRATVERAPDAYNNLRINIGNQMNRIRALLLAALLKLDPGVVIPVPTVPIYTSSVGIAVDPVTGV